MFSYHKKPEETYEYTWYTSQIQVAWQLKISVPLEVYKCIFRWYINDTLYGHYM